MSCLGQEGLLSSKLVPLLKVLPTLSYRGGSVKGLFCVQGRASLHGGLRQEDGGHGDGVVWSIPLLSSSQLQRACVTVE